MMLRALCRNLPAKVGQAKHTVAARLPRYKTEVLGGVRVVDGSPTLRILVYGTGPAILWEREIQQVARRHASRAQVIDETGVRRRVGSETYVGVGMIDALCTLLGNAEHRGRRRDSLTPS
jgi:hypothetical protein